MAVVWEASNLVTPEPEVLENTFLDLLIECNMVAKLTGGMKDSWANLSTKNRFRQIFLCSKNHQRTSKN